MSNPFESLIDRANQYVTAHGTQLKHELGRGKDGTVFSTSEGNAIKVFVRSDTFEREVACYLRLEDRNIRQIMGHFVPRLIAFDRDLLVLEMTVVKRPFALDFASAFLDYPPDFPPDVLEQWEAEKSELFGSNWSKVKILLDAFVNECDIYFFDVHPGNITFTDES